MTSSTADANREWMTQIVEQYQDRLVRYAQRIVGDAQAASDIVQDTFMKLCAEDVDRLQPIVAPWLYRVCRNRAFDVRKKERRMSSTQTAELDTQVATTDSPDHAATVNDEAAKALRALSELPENQQEVIRLRIEHGLNYAQISEVTELSVSNVGYLLHTGLKTLRSRMTQSQIS
ncbi:MAG: sigma-70 family RNA polymerase sigma factor [Planctomycetales bacterium]|nr:sigma-70 family RNA polymerase sigma factor [Planctomycetales bacterium]